MTTDKELLELAAKAAGMNAQSLEYDDVYGFLTATPRLFWNPLTDDGDALRLAVKFGLTIESYIGANGFANVLSPCHQRNWAQDHNGDPYAATRRAIVRAAAEIGRSMK